MPLAQAHFLFRQYSAPAVLTRFSGGGVADYLAPGKMVSGMRGVRNRVVRIPSLYPVSLAEASVARDP